MTIDVTIFESFQKAPFPHWKFYDPKICKMLAYQMFNQPLIIEAFEVLTA